MMREGTKIKGGRNGKEEGIKRDKERKDGTMGKRKRVCLVGEL